jgi:hypothetical protein
VSRVVLAHGPILEVLALGLVIVTLGSLLISLAVWRCSRPPKISARNGCVPPILIGLSGVLITWGAAALVFATDWNIVSAIPRTSSEWLLLSVILLPSALVGALYVFVRRLAVSTQPAQRPR